MGSAPSVGSRFARALAAKDREALRAMLHRQIEFRALTPRRAWEADDPDAVLDILLGNWFEDSDEIRALESVEVDAVADREQLRYRLSIANPEGSFVVEQQGYLTADEDGQIEWMRLVCSGFRPATA